jgi:hypothetical protein
MSAVQSVWLAIANDPAGAPQPTTPPPPPTTQTQPATAV